jgi:hypothetical protein
MHYTDLRKGDDSLQRWRRDVEATEAEHAAERAARQNETVAELQQQGTLAAEVAALHAEVQELRAQVHDLPDVEEIGEAVAELRTENAETAMVVERHTIAHISQQFADAYRDAVRDLHHPVVKGTYNPAEKYRKHDEVARDGATFVALRNDPGPCPGSGWQLRARQGQRGVRGDRGPQGPRGFTGPPGLSAPQLTGFEIDAAKYTVALKWSDGTRGPVLDLRPLFQQFQRETA